MNNAADDIVTELRTLKGRFEKLRLGFELLMFYYV